MCIFLSENIFKQFLFLSLGLLWIPQCGWSGGFPGSARNWVHQIHLPGAWPDLRCSRVDVLRDGSRWGLLRHLLAHAVWPGSAGAGPGLADTSAEFHWTHRGHHSGQPIGSWHAEHQGASSEADQECAPCKQSLYCFQDCTLKHKHWLCLKKNNKKNGLRWSCQNTE